MNWNFDEVVTREGTDCIKYDLIEDIFGRKDIIPMWVADMDFRTPAFIIEKLFGDGLIMKYTVTLSALRNISFQKLNGSRQGMAGKLKKLCSKLKKQLPQ